MLKALATTALILIAGAASAQACSYGSTTTTESCSAGQNSTCFGQKTSGQYCVVQELYCNARVNSQGVVERFWEVSSTSVYFVDQYDMICVIY